MTALLNPVVAIVALWMGSTATQWQKVPVAAFAGALLGSAVLYILVRLGLSEVGRAAAGVFIAQFLIGLVWAAIGYRFLRRSP